MLRAILITVGFAVISIPILLVFMVLLELTPEQMRVLGLLNGILIYGLFSRPALDSALKQRLEENKKKERKDEEQ